MQLSIGNISNLKALSVFQSFCVFSGNTYIHVVFFFFFFTWITRTVSLPPSKSWVVFNPVFFLECIGRWGTAEASLTNVNMPELTLRLIILNNIIFHLKCNAVVHSSVMLIYLYFFYIYILAIISVDGKEII